MAEIINYFKYVNHRVSMGTIEQSENLDLIYCN